MRVGSGRPAGRPGGVGQDWVPTELFAQETQDPCTLQGVESCRTQNTDKPRAGRVGAAHGGAAGRGGAG